jgi:transcription elongation factor GreB
MSRAFIREDVDPPERSGRVRSASGLPPGAKNYITTRGAKRLREELARLQGTGDNKEREHELQRIIESITIVEPLPSGSEAIAFGSTVTIEAANGARSTFTIVGVDEVGFEPDGVSWISAIGKALLAAEVGDRVTIGEQLRGRIVAVEQRGG